MIKSHPVFKKVLSIFVIFVMLIASFGLFSVLTQPRLETDAADNQYSLYLNGARLSDVNAYYLNNTVYIPASMIGSKLKNAGITVDTAGKRLVIDMTKQNLLLPDSSLTSYIKTNMPVAYIPAKTIDSNLYFPLNVLKSFFKVKYTIGSSSITIADADSTVKLAQINKASVKAIPSLRPVSEPAPVEYITSDDFGNQYDSGNSISYNNTTNNTSTDLALYANDVVTILDTYDNYYKVELTDGAQAYIAKSDVTISDVNLSTVDFYSPKKNKSTTDGKLSINWEYVNLAQNGATPAAPPSKIAGLDVLCPIWFAFTDSNAAVKNVGDKGYTETAHAKGYKVWATVTNSFDGGITNAVLGNKTLRDKAIAQFIFYSLLYDVDGINIDFEGVKDADGPNLTTFVSEMRTQTEKMGLSLSIDVLVPRSWNIEYEYGKLYKYVDYIALMTYDEHYSSSKTPGPIASLPWVEDNIKRILKEGVPANKVLLGIPTYTRTWTVDANDNVLKNPSSSMLAIREVVGKKGLTPQWLDDKKLYYFSYTEDGEYKKVWIEDSRSISHKLALVQTYNLAGAATWRRGFEEPAVWNVYAGMLKNGQSADIYQKPY